MDESATGSGREESKYFIASNGEEVNVDPKDQRLLIQVPAWGGGGESSTGACGWSTVSVYKREFSQWLGASTFHPSPSPHPIF